MSTATAAPDARTVKAAAAGNGLPSLASLLIGLAQRRREREGERSGIEQNQAAGQEARQ
jgi:hypothetical protein